MTIAIKMTQEQWNKVVNMLADKPYREVYEIIATIHEQAAKQLKEEQADGNK